MRNEDKEQLSYILKTSISKSNHKNELDALMEQYEHYKKNFVKDITFDTTKIGLSMLICLWIIFLFSYTMIGSEGVLYVSFFPKILLWRVDCKWCISTLTPQLLIR